MPKKIKDGEYVINLDEHADFGTEESRRFGNKNIETSIYKIQANNLTMSGNISIGFIDFTPAGKALIDYISLFSHYNFEKNDAIALS